MEYKDSADIQNLFCQKNILFNVLKENQQVSWPKQKGTIS